MTNTLLVVLDPEAKEHPALEKALTLAKYQDIKLHLLSCEHTEYLDDGYFFDAVEVKTLREEYVANCKEALESIADPLREEGLEVTTDAQWGTPGYKLIVEAAENSEVAMVVHGAGRHGALSRMFLTHDDWQLVRLCPKPLLLVKGKAWGHPPTILAAVDPSHHREKPVGLDHKLLKAANELSEASSGEVHVVHAFRPVPLSGVYPEQAKQAHKKVFADLMAEFNYDNAHQHLVEEAPETGIASIAAEVNADLVVMGGISRSRLEDVFIGSTTDQIIDYLETDVLVLKPDQD